MRRAEKERLKAEKERERAMMEDKEGEQEAVVNQE